LEKLVKISLNSSTSIPLVGFGTYKIDDEIAEQCVEQALTVGYRHIDTAEGYGNELGVGRAIKRSGLRRDDFFVTTKMWPGNPAWGDEVKSYADTLRALDQSLEKLGLDYVDLYLIHAPCAGVKRLQQWEALLEAQSSGKARSVGVSNFSIDHLEEIRRAGLPNPDANQIELHPWSQKPELTEYLAHNAITAIAYSSLVPLEGWRVSTGLDDNTKSEEMIRDGAETRSPFREMAARYQVSEAQILLRWGIQKGYPVLPKSTHPDRISHNFDLFSFEISDEDMESIAAMDLGPGVAWAVGDPTLIFQ
jgi:2,5-diketo-D-gluconate reductase A